MSEATSTPTLAWSWAGWSVGKLSPATSNDTVKPMPASTPTSMMSGQPIDSSKEIRRKRVTRNDADQTPRRTLVEVLPAVALSQGRGRHAA